MFPSVVNSAKGGTTTTNTTSHPITMPASIVAGNLLVCIFTTDGNPQVTQSGGWTRIIQEAQGANVKTVIFFKYATGGDTLTLTTDTAEQSTHICYQLQDAAPPIAQASQGNSTNSNPPLLNTGTSRDYLWMAVRGGDSTVVASGAPSGYANLNSQTASGTGGASTSVAYKTATAASDDPGTFTSSSEQWVAFTLAFGYYGQYDLVIGDAPTGSNDASYGSGAWTNPTNITDRDEVYATRQASGTGATNYLKANNFGLSVPSGATILGIQVSIKKLRTGGTTGNTRDNSLRLLDASGAVTGDNKADTATNWGTTDDTYVYGGASDLWGASWTYSDVNDADFGVVLSVAGATSGSDRTANVDNIRVIVYYTTLNGPPSVNLDTADEYEFRTGAVSIDFTGNDPNGDDVDFQLEIDQLTQQSVVDSYDTSGAAIDTGGFLYASFPQEGQSFTPNATGNIESVKFFLKRTGTTPGNAVARIYAHAGTYGSSSVGTGTPLATSNAVDISACSTATYQAFTFTFPAGEQIQLTSGTRYVAVVEYTGGDGSNYLVIGFDNSSPSHGGNRVYKNGSSWVSWSAGDCAFEVVFAARVYKTYDSTIDAGFSNVTNGGDTRPFTSGNQHRFTFQSEAIIHRQDSTGSNFGFGEFSGVRYRGMILPVFGNDNAITKIGFSRNKGSQGVKVYFDTVVSNAPEHAVGSELYSFTIPNASLVNGYGEYTLPVPLPVTAGVVYCFYLAPWNTSSNVYQDDYQDVQGISSGTEITYNGGWSTENLSFRYRIYGSGLLDPGLYTYRLRATDPAGSNSYGSWTATRTLRVFKADRELSKSNQASAPTDLNHPSGATVFTNADYDDVDTADDSKVSQTGTNPYILQKKDMTSAQNIDINIEAHTVQAGADGGSFTDEVAVNSALNTVWTNPTNVFGTADGVYAVTVGTSSQNYKITSGFAIPANATLTALRVKTTGHADVANGSSIAWTLAVGGSSWGIQNTSHNTGADTTSTTSGSALWSSTISVSDLNSGLVELRGAAGSGVNTLSIDRLSLAVSYTTPNRKLYVDIWNYNTSSWVNLLTDSSRSAETDTDFTVTVPSNANYFSSGWVTVRIRLDYSDTLRVDEFTVTPAAGATSKSVNDSGAGTDGVSITVQLSRSDSGSGSDALTSILAQLSRSDSGSGSDVLSLIAQLSLNDSATSSDVLGAILAFLSLQDSGSGVDALSIANTFALQDSANGIDVANIYVTFSLSDSASGVDQANITVPINLNDSASASEALSILAQLALSDSAVGNDALTILATIAISDTAASSDALAILANIMLNDSASGSEQIDVQQLAYAFTLNESGSATDTLHILNTFALLDGALATEVLNVMVALAISDSGSLSQEALAFLNTMALNDSGSGADIVSAFTAIILNDTGSSSDALAILASLAVQDTALGQEALSFFINVTLNDTATATDILEALRLMAVSDSGSGADAISILTTIALSDSAVHTDALSILVNIALSENASGADIQSIVASLSLQDSGSGSEDLFTGTAFDLSDSGTGYDESFNMFPNPSFENSTFWSGLSISSDSAYALFGTKSGRGSCQFTGGVRGTQSYLHSGSAITLLGGKPYTFSIYVYVPADSVIETLEISFRVWSSWSKIAWNRQAVVPGQWTRLYVTYTPPATEQFRVVVADPIATGFTGTVYWWNDGALLEQSSSVRGYYDGDNGGRWTGTSHQSQSARANLAIINSFSLLDSAISSEILSILAQIAVSDSGNSAESVQILANIALNDTGLGSEIVNVLANLYLNDSAVGSEVVNIFKQFAVSDSGAGVDSLAILAVLALNELGYGADIVSNLTNYLTVIDEATGTETIDYTRLLDLLEEGLGIDDIILEKEGAILPNKYPLVLDAINNMTIITQDNKITSLEVKSKKTIIDSDSKRTVLE
jgi:hypothetical protein